MSVSSGDGRVIRVHPNSMAARKWGKSTWLSRRNLWAEAAEAQRAGLTSKAAGLRAAAARQSTTETHCG